MSQSGQAEKGPAAYGREALSQWGDAARYGVRALAARRATAKGMQSAEGMQTAEGMQSGKDKPGLVERLNPTKTEKGGKAGDMADLALSKLGSPGRLASKVKLGSRLVERVSPSSEEKEPEEEGNAEPEPEAPDMNGLAEGDGVGAGAPLPIQGSIDVALPVAAVFDLCTRFEEYPRIVDRVVEVEVEDDSHITVLVRAWRRRHELSIELVDELAEERLDWECVGDLEHSGVLTFHPLAPRLTRVELTIERESEGPVEHLGRVLALPERGLKQELRRFKGVAELWEDGKGYEPTEIGIFAEEPVEEDEEDEEISAEEEEDTEGDQEEAASAER
jgi:uncharacterized membrane protein